MEYYLSVQGSQSGPHTQFEIIDRIRDGGLKGDELVWKKGDSDWKPLKQVVEFEGYWPLTAEVIAKAEQARSLARTELDRPQPWLRFWARMVDYTWFYLIFMMFLGAVLPQEKLAWVVKLILAHAPVGSVIYLLFVPVEAWMLSRRGTTPGKALLRIQVCRKGGGFPSYRQALMRSLLVFIRGYALGLELISLFAMSWARARLLRQGSTSWDEATGLRVEHGEPEVWRMLVLIFAIVGLVMMAVIIFALSPEFKEMTTHLPE